MSQISIVQLAQVTTSKRWDADYFAPDFLRLEHKLKSHPNFFYLGNLLDFDQSFYGVLPKSRDYLSYDDKNSDLFLCKGEDIRKNCLNYQSWVKIPETYSALRSHVRKGDLLILIKGKTIDNEDGVAWISEQVPRVLFNGSVFRVLFKNADPRFFYAFFRTSFFTQQKRRIIANATVEYNAIDQIKKYMVICPSIASQHAIGKMIDEYFQLLRQSRNFYLQAQQLLDSELGLDKLIFQKPVGYTANFSELETSRRSDAQHYQPHFRQLLAHLSAFQSKKIRDLRIYNRWGIQPIYVENGEVAVVNSQHLGPKHINYDGLEKTTNALFRASPEAHIQTNDLLIYTTGAYIGRTNVYLQDTPALASNHVNLLRFNQEVDAAAMALIFQSIVGQFQTQMYARGSAQAELYPADIDRFVVPILKLDMQLKIGTLVRESFAKERESKRLLEHAKTRVVQLIEEGVQS